MLIPASLYGSFREVRLRMRKMTKALAQGIPFEAAMGATELIDTHKQEGWLVIAHPDADFGGSKNFYVELPVAELLAATNRYGLPRSYEGTVFNACLESAWGVLLLLPRGPYRLFDDRHRWLPFLRAAGRFWPVFEAEGARFKTSGLLAPDTVSQKVTMVDYVLGNAGIYERPPRDPWSLAPGPSLPSHWPELVEAYARQHEPPAE